MHKNEDLVKSAKQHLRQAHRNVGRAWKEIQKMKSVLARAEHLHPLKPQL